MKLNKKLLFELLMTETPYGEEEKVVKIIKRELKKLGFKYFQDKVGNIIAQRGEAKKYPLLNAHMDIVDLNYSWGDYWDDYDRIEEIVFTYNDLLYECVNCKDCINYYDCLGYCEKNELNGYIFNVCEYFYPTLKGEKKVLKWAKKNKLESLNQFYYEDTTPYKVYEKNGKIKGKGKYRVLGGDDKCGVFLALELAKYIDIPMKLLFTVGEEVGCIGIKYFTTTFPHWFKDVKYSITIDRREGDNLLASQLGVRSCTKKFAAELASAGIMEGIPVKIKDGSLADVVHIRELVKDAVNVSAGYYNAHTENEYIVWKEVVGVFRWLKRFMEGR